MFVNEDTDRILQTCVPMAAEKYEPGVRQPAEPGEKLAKAPL